VCINDVARSPNHNNFLGRIAVIVRITVMIRVFVSVSAGRAEQATGD
jgi:hypothetical protein